MPEQEPYPPDMRSVLAALVVILAACNGETADTTQPTASTTTTIAATTTAAPPPPPFEEVAVELSEEGFLVDGEGRSLYLFTLDTERTSTCEGDCAGAWPPFLGDPVAGDGVDQARLGNAERGNGAIQVTYGGHPLYRYRGDGEAGDTEGHGFNDLWFLVGPDGEPLGS